MGFSWPMPDRIRYSARDIPIMFFALMSDRWTGCFNPNHLSLPCLLTTTRTRRRKIPSHSRKNRFDFKEARAQHMTTLTANDWSPTNAQVFTRGNGKGFAEAAVGISWWMIAELMRNASDSGSLMDISYCHHWKLGLLWKSPTSRLSSWSLIPWLRPSSSYSVKEIYIYPIQSLLPRHFADG